LRLLQTNGGAVGCSPPRRSGDSSPVPVG
jgi:hypothetical protein